jgi:hypothetical protein
MRAIWPSAPRLTESRSSAKGGRAQYRSRCSKSLRGTYFTGTSVPSPLDAQHRIQQALGLPTTEDSDRGLAFFWTPIANIARPAYSADITSQLPTLPTYSDGSYQAVTTGAPAGFTYLDYSDDTKTYSTLTDYVEWNQAQTIYPWSAMGYTYNWNSLQTSSTSTTLGYDPLAPSSPFGLSEFIVSAGTKIVNEAFVPNAQLGIWAVPEPSAWVIAILGLTGVGAAVRPAARLRGPAVRLRGPAVRAGRAKQGKLVGISLSREAP